MRWCTRCGGALGAQVHWVLRAFDCVRRAQVCAQGSIVCAEFESVRIALTRAQSTQSTGLCQYSQSILYTEYIEYIYIYNIIFIYIFISLLYHPVQNLSSIAIIIA